MTDIFEKFNSINVMIIGDVMMDSYIWGKVDRISPEAPVPIVRINKKENRLGGAANVALNIQSLGAKPFICAVTGNDKEADEFLALLKEQNLSDQGILKISTRQTTVKTRIIAHNQQMLRLDSETEQNISDADTYLMLGIIKKVLSKQKIDVIIFEDYDKGLITEKLIDETVKLAKKQSIITVVDPKKKNFLSYKGVDLFKPNLKELKEGLKIDIDLSKTEELEGAVTELKRILNAKAVMLTLSESGVYISSDLGNKYIQAHKRDIADVSGAGDTVIATAALCMACGIDAFRTSEIANLAGGLVCEHIGVVPIDKAKLLEEVKKMQ